MINNMGFFLIAEESLFLFTDVLIKHVSASKEQAERTYSQIERVLDQLQMLRTQTEEEQGRLSRELEGKIVLSKDATSKNALTPLEKVLHYIVGTNCCLIKFH